MKTNYLLFFCLVFVLIHDVGTVRWVSDNGFDDLSILYVCTGNNVTLPWKYVNTDPAEHLIDQEWTLRTVDGKEGLIATSVMGTFLQVPIWNSVITKDLSFIPNAGLSFDNASSSDSGNYSVLIHFDSHGTTVRAHGHVFVDVGDSDRHCPNRQDELRVLRQRYNQLKAQMDNVLQQNAKLTDMVIRLQNPCNGGDKPTSCVDVQKHNNQSGVYIIYPDSSTPVDVYCDQDTQGGGWAVIQRRQDGSVDFFRNWTDYDNGFGFLSGEFWLGLKNIYLLTSSQPQSLRIDLTDFDLNKAHELYDLFNLTSAATNYRIYVQGYSGNAGDSIISNSSYYTQTSQNMAFSTIDRDNDKSTGQCADSGHGAWWYNWCADGNLNAGYGRPGLTSWSYLNWYSWYQENRSLKGSEMKVRPRRA